jgi:hypothetical protein
LFKAIGFQKKYGHGDRSQCGIINRRLHDNPQGWITYFIAYCPLCPGDRSGWVTETAHILFGDLRHLSKRRLAVCHVPRRFVVPTQSAKACRAALRVSRASTSRSPNSCNSPVIVCSFAAMASRSIIEQHVADDAGALRLSMQRRPHRP